MHPPFKFINLIVIFYFRYGIIYNQLNSSKFSNLNHAVLIVINLFQIEENPIESPSDVYFNQSFSISIFNVPKNISKYYFGDQNIPFCNY